MNTPILLRLRVPALVLSALFAVMTLPALTAADSPTPPTSPGKKLPSLPLTATFGKGTPGENGGIYALTLKNTSTKALTVSTTIIWSVTTHTREKTIELPAREIIAGGTWTINDLAFDDRIIVSAEGYEKLDLKTPPGK